MTEESRQYGYGGFPFGGYWWIWIIIGVLFFLFFFGGCGFGPC
ncbi:MAG: hypothetical protein ACOWWO_13605 [Peptococcaceae bacterium]